jgi:hypothetical protein
MVRLIPKVINGKRVWAEDAPELCGDGHDQLIPGWGPCPACGQMLRRWTCRAVEAGRRCDEVLVDPEHVHDSKRGL